MRKVAQPKLVLTLVCMMIVGIFAVASAAPTKITFATRDVRDVYPEIVAAFNASHPDIEVELLPVDTDEYVTKLINMFVSGVGPDAFFVFEGDILNWAHQGLLERLDGYLAKDPDLNFDAIYDATWGAMTYNEGIYGISEYVNPNGLVWFNKTMYEEAGLENPIHAERRGGWTMEVMRDNARKLTRQSGDGDPDVWGLYVANWWGPIWSFLMSNGFSFSDADGNLALNSDANLRAVEYVSQWTVEDGSTNTYDWPNEAEMLMMKRLGMTVAGGWYTWVIPEIVPIEVDVVVMPEGITGQRAAMISNPAIAMNPNSNHKPETWTFMKYILVGEGARMRALVEGDLPSAKQFAHLVEGSGPNWQEVMSRSMQWAVPLPSELILRPGLEGSMLYGGDDPTLEAVFRGNRDAKSVLDELQRIGEALIPIDEM